MSEQTLLGLLLQGNGARTETGVRSAGNQKSQGTDAFAKTFSELLTQSSKSSRDHGAAPGRRDRAPKSREDRAGFPGPGQQARDLRPDAQTPVSERVEWLERQGILDREQVERLSDEERMELKEWVAAGAGGLFAPMAEEPPVVPIGDGEMVAMIDGASSAEIADASAGVISEGEGAADAVTLTDETIPAETPDAPLAPKEAEAEMVDLAAGGDAVPAMIDTMETESGQTNEATQAADVSKAKSEQNVTSAMTSEAMLTDQARQEADAVLVTMTRATEAQASDTTEVSDELIVIDELTVDVEAGGEALATATDARAEGEAVDLEAEPLRMEFADETELADLVADLSVEELQDLLQNAADALEVQMPEGQVMASEGLPVAALRSMTMRLLEMGGEETETPSLLNDLLLPGGARGLGADASIAAIEGVEGAQLSTRAPDEIPVTLSQRVASIERVEAAMRLAVKRGISRVSMQLSPPDLGKVQINLQVKGGVLEATLQVESVQAQRMLQDSLQQLRENLAQQGIELGSFDVEAQGQQQQDRGNDPREFWQVPRDPRATTAGLGAEEDVAGVQPRRAPSRPDGLVDVTV